jgi:hypothetical protein
MSVVIVKSGRVATVFLLLCSALSCQTHPNRVIHQTEELTITLREIPAGYPSLEPYNHSYAIQTQDLSTILESLHYEAASLLPFSRGRRRHVFTEQQREFLGSALSEALNLAQPQEVVAFSVADTDRPNRRTKGLVFVLGDELHLIIEELQKPVYQGEEHTYQRQIPRWELLPGDKQRHYASRADGKGAITNWIITPLR